MVVMTVIMMNVTMVAVTSYRYLVYARFLLSVLHAFSHLFLMQRNYVL